MHIEFSLYYIIIAAIFFIPFLSFQFLPGRKSLFVASIAWALITMWIWQHNWDYRFEDDRFGTGPLVFALFCAAGVLGIPSRAAYLAIKSKKLSQPLNLTRREKFIISTFVSCLAVWQTFNYNDVCISKMRRLSDNEIIKSYAATDKNEETYIHLSSRGSRSIFGTSRREILITAVPDKNASETEENFGYQVSFDIDVCGNAAGISTKEGLSKKAVESAAKYFPKVER